MEQNEEAPHFAPLLPNARFGQFKTVRIDDFRPGEV
jgi:hypothetical protein